MYESWIKSCFFVENEATIQAKNNNNALDAAFSISSAVAAGLFIVL